MNVRFGSEADTCAEKSDVRFTPNSDRENGPSQRGKTLAAVVPRPLCKFGIEKDVERSDLSVVNNDDIQSGVVWGLAFRA